MKIRFIGAHNSESKITKYATIILDEDIAIDAGSLASGLTFLEQKKIKAIFLTHGHYDHIKEIPAFAFNNTDKITNIFGNKETLEILRSHLLDGLIYPDFIKKNHFLKKPTVILELIKPYDVINYGEYGIKPVPVNHTVTTNGFEIKSKNGKKIFISGDTGPGLHEVWKQIKPELMIIDLTFPNKLEKTANNSKHLCPKMLENEIIDFYKINKYYPKLIATHLNPKFEKEICGEILNISDKLGINIECASEEKTISI